MTEFAKRQQNPILGYDYYISPGCIIRFDWLTAYDNI